ncbi:MAG: hypothetical protein A2984_00545 [Omnitrophica WOR_2 bacterium RIFCSPLOWO2_01_FULL_41_12]|nr:MAG: hypothetical protein A2984_00545 [Omnitrophica WOR_2 bacterium RIFCSPLOWO2_01_FULL_41_12]
MSADFELKEIVALSLLKEHILSTKHLVFEVSTDYCMKPFLLNDDQIIIHKVAAKDLTSGDVVVYQGGNCFYVHRFLYKYLSKVNGNSAYMLITKGDNLIYPDSPFPEEKLIGKAVIIRRKNNEVCLEGFFWRKVNYILGILCLSQLFIYRLLRFIKIFFWKDRTIPFAEPLKKIFTLPLKPIVSVLRLCFS